jgi:bacterioferritin
MSVDRTAPSQPSSRPAVPPRPAAGAGPSAPAPSASSGNGAFLTDVRAIRERARRHLLEGAVTEGYRARKDAVVKLLNDALATEIVCVLRYKRHAFTAKGIHAEPVVAEFREHATEEQAHADRIAERITQLGGEPDFDPAGLVARSHSEYDASPDLVGMIREDLVAERVAIESYGEAIRFVGDGDPTTRRLLEEILAAEEDHADELAKFLMALDVKTETPAPGASS